MKNTRKRYTKGLRKNFTEIQKNHNSQQATFKTLIINNN